MRSKESCQKLNFSDEDYKHLGKNGEKMTIGDAQILGSLYLQLYLGTYEKFLGYMLDDKNTGKLMKDYDLSQLVPKLENNLFHYVGD